MDKDTKLGLSDLMDQNTTCYEYVNGLPKDIRENLEKRDFGSFEEIRHYVAEVHGEQYADV